MPTATGDRSHLGAEPRGARCHLEDAVGRERCDGLVQERDLAGVEDGAERLRLPLEVGLHHLRIVVELLEPALRADRLAHLAASLAARHQLAQHQDALLGRAVANLEPAAWDTGEQPVEVRDALLEVHERVALDEPEQRGQDVVAADLLRGLVHCEQEPRALSGRNLLDARLPPTPEHDRRSEAHAADAVRRVEGVARVLVRASDGDEGDALGEAGAGARVEQQRLEAPMDAGAIVQHDVVGEQLGARCAEERGGERRLAAAGKPREEEAAPAERDAGRMQGVRGASRLEVPPRRVVHGVVGERAQTVPPQRREAAPAERALRALAPAAVAEREVEAHVEPPRGPGLARERDLRGVVEAEAEEPSRTGEDVTVDARGRGAARKDRLGRQLGVGRNRSSGRAPRRRGAPPSRPSSGNWPAR